MTAEIGRLCSALLPSALFVASLLLTPAAALAFEAAAVERSVVRLIQLVDGKPQSTGTGFVIGPGGLIATNNHVVACHAPRSNACQMIVLLKSGANPEAIPASVLSTSQDYDLAVIKAPNLDRPNLALAVDEPEKGSPVYAIGFPGIADQVVDGKSLADASVTSGVISRIISASWGHGRSTFRLVQHNADINPGNSGGPLLDDCGRVVGINTAVANVQIVPEALVSGNSPIQVPNGVYLASHISSLIGELKRNNISYTSSASVCKPQLGTGSVNWIVAVAATAALGMAFAAFRRPPKVIYETYTQFLRRGHGGEAHPKPPMPDNPRPVPQPKLVVDAAKFELAGTDSSGRSVAVAFRLAAGQSVVIGRDSSVADCAIDDDTVSRQHIRVKLLNGKVHVEDLNSSNGVAVNGGACIAPCTLIPLKIGDRIELGEVKLKLKLLQN